MNSHLILKSRNPFLHALFHPSSRSWLVALFFCSALLLQAQSLGERVEGPGGHFSVRPPSGWAVKKDAGQVSLSAQGDGGLNFQVKELEHEGTLAGLMSASVEALDQRFPDFKKLDDDTFETKSGMKGIVIFVELRVEEGGIAIRQMLYLFNGRPGHKILVSCGMSSDDDNRETRGIFEEVVSSLRFAE